MLKAIDKFYKLDEGVLGIVRAADVYAIHVMAKIRKTEPNMDSIQEILSGKKMSGFNLIGTTYKENELELLEKEGHFKEIGQQIIVAAHTALESYLILKFREYYSFLSSHCEESFIEETLKKFKFRSLDDFKKAYHKFFGIHIPSFDFVYSGTDGCNFVAKDSWEALNLIYDARNDIVHKGESMNYKVATLMDSWYPFEFVRNWVPLFDANFNMFIYEKKESKLYKEYKVRAIKYGVLNKK